MRNGLTNGNLALDGFDDIFKPNPLASNRNGEQVSEVPVSELFAPDFHPFRVVEDLTMQRLVNSVKNYGCKRACKSGPFLRENSLADRTCF